LQWLSFGIRMKIAHGVEMLTLEVNMGAPSIIHPTLVWDEEKVILVDAGVPGQQEVIRAEVEKVGVAWDKVNVVILTHQDIDHVGSLPAILAQSKHSVEVLAHAVEKPYIQGDITHYKFNRERFGPMLASLPDEQQKPLEYLMDNFPKSKVDRTFVDGDVLPYCGGITILFTPGHTPGHVALYLNKHKVLIAGDAMTAANGKLAGPSASATPDMETALKSLHRFKEFDIKKVICYHGGLVAENVNAQITELTKQA